MGNIGSTDEAFYARYSLGKQLGKGSQGRVHVCVDRETGAAKAVKIIDRSSKTSWATYRREVELCRAATHKNVIAVLEEFVDCSYCYVVMDKFEGHLRKGLKWVASREDGTEAPGLPDSALRHIIRQALSAIAHLHKCEIVHRDVKAHNLFTDTLDLRDERCHVVLGDFGLAKRLEHGSYLSAQVGTRKYWAPELYDKKYWHVVDVFAIGVLIFLASTSLYPFLDEDQTCHRDVFEDGSVPDDLSPEARSFMRRCLEKDPQKRPTAAQLELHPWMLGTTCRSSMSKDDSRAVSKPPSLRLDDQEVFGPKVCCSLTALLPISGDHADDIEVENLFSILPANEDPSEVYSGNAAKNTGKSVWRAVSDATPSTATYAEISNTKSGAAGRCWGADTEGSSSGGLPGNEGRDHREEL